MKGYMRMSDAVKEFSVTRQTLYNWINAGNVSTEKLGNANYLKVKDLESCSHHKVGEQPGIWDESEVEEMQKNKEESNTDLRQQQIENLSTAIETMNSKYSQESERMLTAINSLNNEVVESKKEHYQEVSKLKVSLRTWKMISIFLFILFLVLGVLAVMWLGSLTS